MNVNSTVGLEQEKSTQEKRQENSKNDGKREKTRGDKKEVIGSKYKMINKVLKQVGVKSYSLQKGEVAVLITLVQL